VPDIKLVLHWTRWRCTSAAKGFTRLLAEPKEACSEDDVALTETESQIQVRVRVE